MTSNTRAEFVKAVPVLAVLAAAWFAHWMSRAPRPIPASAPPDAFSAERIPLVFSVRELSFGLPKLPEIAPRPPHLIPEPNRRMDRSRALHSDFTYSIATIDLGSSPLGEDSTSEPASFSALP